MCTQVQNPDIVFDIGQKNCSLDSPPLLQQPLCHHNLCKGLKMFHTVSTQIFSPPYLSYKVVITSTNYDRALHHFSARQIYPFFYFGLKAILFSEGAVTIIVDRQFNPRLGIDTVKSIYSFIIIRLKPTYPLGECNTQPCALHHLAASDSSGFSPAF